MTEGIELTTQEKKNTRRNINSEIVRNIQNEHNLLTWYERKKRLPQKNKKPTQNQTLL